MKRFALYISLSAMLVVYLSLAAVLLSGCDFKPSAELMPEVNEQNCQLESIKQIKDEAVRAQFAGLCSRRPIGNGATEQPKNWLDLTAS